MKVIVTGGAGFIGSAVCRLLVTQKKWEVLNIDKLTYAANINNLTSIDNHPNYSFKKLDICDAGAMQAAFEEFQPDGIMHLAAESHVDRSLDGPEDFIQTNIVGTYRLLEVARNYWEELPTEKKANFRFHHISTDEVYGSLGDEGLFTEETPYQPNSPYSASKASSDHLIRAWHHSYGLPVVMSNCSNNYGPYQFPEKLIPLMVLNLISGKKLPIYGDGKNTRDWLHVDDHADALALIFEKGEVGEKYNVGGHNELTNLEIVEKLVKLVASHRQDLSHLTFDEVVQFVRDRPGHDWRYAIDASKIERELGWTPQHDVNSGLAQTVGWYLENESWWRPILENTYQGERLG